MPSTILGLPLHPLIVHATVVMVPLSTATGENLEHSLPETKLIEEHAELGDQLIWFTVALFVFAAAYWWLDRRRTATPEAEQSRDRTRTITAVVGVLAVLTALGTGVQVARIGHSGAKAAWSQTGSAGG